MLDKEDDGTWSWFCNILSGGEASGSGFATAQAALVDASRNEGIKGSRFFAVTNVSKDELIGVEVQPDAEVSVDVLTEEGDPDPHMDE